jgi:hypothetical protein
MQSRQSAGWVPLFSSESAVPVGSVWLGPVDPNTIVRCTCRVRPGLHRGPESAGPARAAPRDPDDDVGGNVDTPLGADPDDLDRIRDFAGQTNLEIIEIDPEGRRVVLSGSAVVVAAAFLAQLAHYKRGGKVCLGCIASLYAPAAIANAVEEVCALEAVSSDPRTPIAERHTAWRPESRRVAVLAVALIAGAALGVALYDGLLTPPSSPFPSTPARPPQQPTPAASSALQNTLQELETAGWKFLDVGQLHEAQDSFLRVLVTDPDRPRAMEGLVAVRRKMAGDNPDVVRQQVAPYRDAVARGAAPGKYYTPSAVKLLATAGQRALREIEAQGERIAVSSPAPIPASPPSNLHGVETSAVRTQNPPAGQPVHPATNSTHPVTPRRDPRSATVPPKAQDRAKPAPTAEAQKPLTVAPQEPAPTTSSGSGLAPAPPPPATPSPQSPPATSTRPTSPAALAPPAVPAAQTTPVAAAPQIPPPAPSRLYAIRIGPVSDRDRAAAIAKQLSSGGFAQAQIDTQTGYRVISEPLPRQEAERLLTALAGRGIHGYLGPAEGATVQVVFGTVTIQRDAEALSARVTAAGYDAWIREATVYIVHVWPYPSDAVTKITDLVKGVASEAAVVADPVSAPAATAGTVPAVSSRQVPAAPLGSQVSPPPPAPQTAAPAANRLFAIQIGPVSDRDRAGAIAKQLAAVGFSQPRITEQTGYRIVSEPLPRTEAAGVVAALAAKGIHGSVTPVSGDTVQIVFGVVTAQKDAEALSARVTAAGYDAWIREATVYTVHVGPYPSASVTAITALIKAGAPEAIVIADPVP